MMASNGSTHSAKKLAKVSLISQRHAVPVKEKPVMNPEFSLFQWLHCDPSCHNYRGRVAWCQIYHQSSRHSGNKASQAVCPGRHCTMSFTPAPAHRKILHTAYNAPHTHNAATCWACDRLCRPNSMSIIELPMNKCRLYGESYGANC